MAANFPSNPSNAQTFVNNGVLYQYFSEKQFWKASKILWAFDQSVITFTAQDLSPGSEYLSTTAFSPSYMISKVSSSHASWIRVYDSQSNSNLDVSRDIRTDPTLSSGVILEAITQGEESYDLSPAIYGYNRDSPATNIVYVKIKNLTAQTVSIAVNLTLINIGS